MEKIQVGMLGLGTVGTGVYRMLQTNAEMYRARLGAEVVVSRIAVKDPSKGRKVQVPDGILTGNASEVVANPAIQVVIELIGGGIGYEYILAAMRAGKHVITADKLAIATKGDELSRAAAENDVDLMFGASVGGGLPVIRWLRDGLAADRPRQLMGIANGTTNFILDLMAEGSPFEEALERAKQYGYAESDASSDLDGEDAAYKLAILARIAFRQRITFDNVYPIEGIRGTEGIRGIEHIDFQYAAKWGYTIKLIAWASEIKGKLALKVHPMLLPKSHPLANINGVDNGFCIVGRAVGQQTLGPGQGAGAEPTASAVIADLLQVGQDIKRKQVRFCPDNSLEPFVGCVFTKLVSRYYLRMELANESGALADVTSILQGFGISASAVEQPETTKKTAEVVIVTWPTAWFNIQHAAYDIGESPMVAGVCAPIEILSPEGSYQ